MSERRHSSRQPDELRVRGVRLVKESRPDYSSDSAAHVSITEKLGCSRFANGASRRSATPESVRAGKLRDRFGLKRAVFVGDRGMAAQARPRGPRAERVRLGLRLASSGDPRPSRKRRERIAAADLTEIRRAVRRDRRKMRKHFDLRIGEGFLFRRRRKQDIAAEAALDGLYVVRTMKASDLQVRPVRCGC